MENIENGILTLLFENNEVKIKVIDNEPCFNLEDVFKILHVKNSGKVKKRLLDEQGVCCVFTNTPSGIQKMYFISETNLYRLISQSRKPEAEKFKHWVISDVLPFFTQDKVAKKIIKELEGLRTKDLEKLMERIK